MCSAKLSQFAHVFSRRAWSHCEIVTLCNTAAGKMINDLVVHRAEDYRRVVEESDIMFKVTCDV